MSPAPWENKLLKIQPKNIINNLHSIQILNNRKLKKRTAFWSQSTKHFFYDHFNQHNIHFTSFLFQLLVFSPLCISSKCFTAILPLACRQPPVQVQGSLNQLCLVSEQQRHECQTAREGSIFRKNSDCRLKETEGERGA